MLIPLHQLVNYFKLNLRGVLHIGAHECEEQTTYLQQGIKNENIYWLEAMDYKVAEMKEKTRILTNEVSVVSKLLERHQQIRHLIIG